jgi:hypothetical protein
VIRFQVPILVLLASCATPGARAAANAKCVTPCGMFTNEGNCESLQRFELRAVRGLSGVVHEWPAEKICASLKGWEVRVHPHAKEADVLCPARSWQHFPGLCVWGYTYDDRKMIEVHAPEWDRSALAHEIAHVAGLAITKDQGHCRWVRGSRFVKMISELEGEPDINVPEKYCSP